MDSDKVNNGCSPSVFRWLACWLVYVFSRFYLFFSEFTFVIQNKGPLLKTSQNRSESLMVFTCTAAANKWTICMAKAMLSQFSFLFWDVLMLVTYWMEANLVSKSLMGTGRVYQGEFKKSLQLHTTLRICRSEVTEPKSFTIPDSARLWTAVIKALITSPCFLLSLAFL